MQLNNMKYFFRNTKGFSLVEVLVASAVLVVISTAVYSLYAKSLQFVSTSRTKIAATSLASELFETIRNLPFSDVGIVNGVPSGKIPRAQTFVRDNFTFVATTSIRNVDDYFDGTVTTTPKDTAPADYKLANLTITCVTCKSAAPVEYNTIVGPKSLEASTTNGSLFVQALDASGFPIQTADVHVVNSAKGIDIWEVTNAQGIFELVGTPPGNQAYAITVTKPGYSTDRNYPTGGAGNPTPIKPYSTVASSTLTQVSFLIDRVSTFDVSSVNTQCDAAPTVDFALRGNKLIGTPNVYKYATTSFVTDGSGLKNLPNIEWDTYFWFATGTAYDLAGTIPPSPITIPPNTTQTVKIIPTTRVPKSLLVTVIDSVTSLPISGAYTTVTLSGTTKDGYTDRGAISQTDWVGGAGQEEVGDTTKYVSADAGIETTLVPGEVRLKSASSTYATSGELVSSTFDAGGNASFFQLQFTGTEPASTTIRFQIATATTSSATTTWNYFGPDGTASTYYSSATGTIASIHANDQYLRYKMLLTTASTTVTPRVQDVAVTFTSVCTPPGQVFFNGLSTGTHSISISKSGYNTYSGTVPVTENWQAVSIPLLAQ